MVIYRSKIEKWDKKNRPQRPKRRRKIMGKVLSNFDIGWPGAISRSVDDIVVSLKNGGTAAIPFGAPVFLTADGEGVVAYSSSASPAQTFASFVGFASRV